MRLAVSLSAALALIAALGLGVFWLVRLAPPPQPPQPRIQLTIRVDTDAAPQRAVLTLLDDVRRVVREGRLGVALVAPSGDSVEVTIRDGADREQALARLRELAHLPVPKSGAETERFTISDAGGGVLRLTATQAAIAEEVARTLDQTIDVLGQRIDTLRLNPTFTRESADRIAIQVERQADTAHLKELIVAPGKLAFRLVDTSVTVEEAKQGQVPPQSEILQDQEGTPYVVENQVSVSGRNLVDAQGVLDQRTNEPILTFRFNAVGRQQFARVTEEKVGSALAVVFDGVVLAAPIVREPIRDGSGQISGNFTVARVAELAILLRSGPLPAPLTIIEERMLQPEPK